MKSLLFQKLEFLVTLLEDYLEAKEKEPLLPLLKEMKELSSQIGGRLFEHFLELEREAKRFLKNPSQLPALKERAILFRNEFWEL